MTELTPPPAPTDAPPPRAPRGDLRWGLVVFVVVLAVYALTAWSRVLEPSPHFHFVDLAQSLLDGKLHTDTPHRRRGEAPRADDPAGLQAAIDRALTDARGNAIGWNDWASYRVIRLKGGDELRGAWIWRDKSREDRRHDFHTLDGRIARVDAKTDIALSCGPSGRGRCDETRYYVSFPPGPALVMLPLVAAFGYHTNDVIITLLFAAANASLFFALLVMLRRRGYSDRSRAEQLWLTALMALGTVAWFSSVRGEVWFTALVMGLTFHLAYILCALDARRPLLAGLFLALGFATRTPLVFAAPFFAMQLFFPASGERPPWGAIARKAAWFALPTLVVGVGLLVYNAARFDNPLEFGHTWLLQGTRDAIRERGLFSPWFLNRNLQAALVNLPVLTATYPFVHITRHGIGLLATTPPLALLLRPRPAGPRRLRLALGITALCIAIPAMFYQNTGWAQFGFRFGLDFMPYLLALVALDGRRVGRWFMVAIGVAIVMNLFGAVTFGRMEMFYYD